MATASQNAANHVGGDVDNELIDEWIKVLSRPNQNKNEHIRDLVRRGVPANLRAQIWRFLANVQQVTQQTNEYYTSLLGRDSLAEKLIGVDLGRTYPNIEYFRDAGGPGQTALHNVIKAYSLHDEEVEYCQGMAFIVGILLLELGEQECFLLLCKIMGEQPYKMREMFKSTMPGLTLCQYQLGCLVQEQIPGLYEHFESQGFYTSLYSTSWFLTLFTSTLPLHLAYRVIDLFLSEGLEMIFRLSVAILQICKVELLQLDIEGLKRYFGTELLALVDRNPDYLIRFACLVSYDSKKMKKLSKEYSTIKAKQEQDTLENRVLSTDNSYLRGRIKELEIENRSLADNLIRGQVRVAQEAEDNLVIKHEMRQIKLNAEEYKSSNQKLQLRVEELEKLLSERIINHSTEAQMLIDALQEELVAVKLREAENHVDIDQLRKKITEQELFIKSLRENVPEDPIAQLEEELSAVKLREAEANFAMKELKSKFNELQTLWFEHLQQVHGVSVNNGSNSQHNSLEQSSGGSVSNQDTLNPLNGGNNSLNTNQQSLNSSNQVSQPSSLTSLASSNPISKFFNNSVIKRASGSSSTVGILNNEQLDDQQELQRIKQEMLTLKLHEADSLAEVTMLRSREMELETQIKIQDNKFKRKEDEFKRVEEELRSEKLKLNDISNLLKEEQRKLTDLEWQRKEEQMMRRVEDVEFTRETGELKQKIVSLEAKIEEMNTAKKVAESGIEPKDALEYQERVAELQSESFRLDAANKKLHDMEKKNSEREKEGD